MDIKNPKSNVKNVLIESDWNLKDTKLQPRSTWRTSINRIRLEFKGIYELDKPTDTLVLIEADWNLK